MEKKLFLIVVCPFLSKGFNDKIIVFLGLNSRKTNPEFSDFSQTCLIYIQIKSIFLNCKIFR